MLRAACLLAVLAAFFALSGCNIRNTITAEDMAEPPAVLAKVVKEPDPLLIGRYHRVQPSEFNHPWSFDYWLVKRGNGYAVYYRYAAPMGKSYRGWAEFVIEGGRMTSNVDGVVFYVEGGAVFMKYPGRDTAYPMVRMDN